jgi:tetratricopeptide (TPR) repeat protein
MIFFGDPSIEIDCLKRLGFYTDKSSWNTLRQALLNCLLLLATVIAPVSADLSAAEQATNWNNLLEQATTLQKQAKYQEAEERLASALKAIDADSTVDELDPRKVLILAPLAELMAKQSKTREAEDLYRRALTICEAAYGSDDRNVAAILAHLASLSTRQRRYAEAEPFFTRAIAISKKTLSADDPELGRLYIELGTLYFKQRKSQEARNLFKQAQTIFEKSYGLEDKTVAEALAFQALVCRQEHNNAEAERLLKRALIIGEKHLPSDSIELATTLDALGSVYVSQGKYSDAAPIIKRALKIYESRYGAESKKVASCLDGLAVLELSIRDYEQCESHAKQALAIAERLYGSDKPELLDSLRILATSYLLQKRNAESVMIFERMLALQRKNSGQPHDQIAFTISKLAGIYSEQHDYQKAENLYRTLLFKDKQAHGDNSPVVASDLDELANVLARQGKQDEAKQFQEEALRLKKLLPGSAKLMKTPQKIEIGPAKSTLNRPFRDKWAVVIGISNFEDPRLNLQYAAKDARDFRNFLVNESNFQADHIKLLIDSEATRDNIIGSLGPKWLGKRAGRHDLVLVYMSSHGSSATKEAKDTNFLAAYDTNEHNLILAGIPMQWLIAGISNIVPSDRIVFVLDVCHAAAVQLTGQQLQTGLPEALQDDAGKGLDRHGTASGQTTPKKVTIDEFNLDELVLGKGQILVASSDANQSSYESKHCKNGVFTYRLIEGLRLRGTKTTLGEAFNFMKERVEDEVLRDRGKLQTPVVVQNWYGPDPMLGTAVQGSPPAARPHPASQPSTREQHGATKRGRSALTPTALERNRYRK